MKYPAVPLSIVLCFFAIAAKPKKSVTKYARNTNSKKLSYSFSDFNSRTLNNNCKCIVSLHRHPKCDAIMFE